LVNVPESLVEVGRSFDQTYSPVLQYDGWRVAMLRYFDAVAPDRFYRVERHPNTNEVFILTAGQADLVICDTTPDGDAPGQAYVLPMERHVAYNFPPGVWHHVVMSPDAHIVLVERDDVACEYAEIPPDTVAAIKAQFCHPELVAP
jgi:ureidoglycolate hydrolase